MMIRRQEPPPAAPTHQTPPPVNAPSTQIAQSLSGSMVHIRNPAPARASDPYAPLPMGLTC